VNITKERKADCVYTNKLTIGLFVFDVCLLMLFVFDSFSVKLREKDAPKKGEGN